MKKILFLVLALFSSLALAGTATISWVNPTTTTAGGPLTGTDALTKFQFWISNSPLPAILPAPTTEVLAAAPLQSTYVHTAPAGTTIYVKMTACNATGCSVTTNQASGVVPYPAAAPGSPQNVTIQVSAQ